MTTKNEILALLEVSERRNLKRKFNLYLGMLSFSLILLIVLLCMLRLWSFSIFTLSILLLAGLSWVFSVRWELKHDNQKKFEELLKKLRREAIEFYEENRKHKVDNIENFQIEYLTNGDIIFFADEETTVRFSNLQNIPFKHLSIQVRYYGLSEDDLKQFIENFDLTEDRKRIFKIIDGDAFYRDMLIHDYIDYIKNLKEVKKTVSLVSQSEKIKSETSSSEARKAQEYFG